MEREAVKGDVEVIEVPNPGSDFVPKSWMEIDKLSTKLVDDNITSIKAQATAAAAAAAGGGPRRTRHTKRRRTKRTKRKRTKRTKRRRAKRTKRRRTKHRKKRSKELRTRRRRRRMRRQPGHCQSGGQDVNVQLAMKSGLDNASLIKGGLNSQLLANFYDVDVS